MIIPATNPLFLMLTLTLKTHYVMMLESLVSESTAESPAPRDRSDIGEWPQQASLCSAYNIGKCLLSAPSRMSLDCSIAVVISGGRNRRCF